MLKHYQDRVLGMSNVLLPGWVKWPQIYSLMQKSKLGLVPIQSRFDFQLSIPNKPIEYLSAGLPILSSLKGKLESILKEYNCGLTYTEGNSEALFDAIMLLYSNKKLLTKMSQNAIELFNKCFDAEHVYTNFADHLEMIVNTAKKVKRMGNRKNGL
jgi:glycosyltransferase involved in cell wall biosynthesis